MVEVVATAKIELKAGQVLDGIGFYMTYGQCENAQLAQAEQLLPMGVAEGCRLKRDIGRDQVISYQEIGRASCRERVEIAEEDRDGGKRQEGQAQRRGGTT